MGEEMWLDEALYKYSGKDYYPFHMPGHKREFCPETLKNPYKVDITEIDGFDNLHHAEGISVHRPMMWHIQMPRA